MPVIMRKTKRGYMVKTPGGTKSKAASLSNAKKQARLLNAVEHGFKPTGKKAKKKGKR